MIIDMKDLISKAGRAPPARFALNDNAPPETRSTVQGSVASTSKADPVMTSMTRPPFRRGTGRRTDLQTD